MNAVLMARSAYATARAPIRTGRSAEYDLFAQITRDISLADAKGKPGFADLVQTLHQNRKLWTVLASDVADPDNALPTQLRAQIFYLARFTEHHTRQVLAGNATVEALLDVNRSIMRGLETRHGARS